MSNKTLSLAVVLLAATAASHSVLSADDTNGITRDDIKRLQINAFAEEMQLEMEQAARSELKTSVEILPVTMPQDAAANMEAATLPQEPSVSSR